MIRLELDAADRAAVVARVCSSDATRRERERLLMVLRSADGWSPPRIAAELGRDEDSVRRWLATYQAGEPLVDAQRSGRPIVLTTAMLEAVRTLLAETERSWTAPALAVWVREQFGVVMHPNWLSVRMHDAGIVWKRTARTLQHKRDPDAHAAATAQISAWKKKQ